MLLRCAPFGHTAVDLVRWRIGDRHQQIVFDPVRAGADKKIAGGIAGSIPVVEFYDPTAARKKYGDGRVALGLAPEDKFDRNPGPGRNSTTRSLAAKVAEEATVSTPNANTKPMATLIGMIELSLRTTTPAVETPKEQF